MDEIKLKISFQLSEDKVEHKMASNWDQSDQIEIRKFGQQLGSNWLIDD